MFARGGLRMAWLIGVGMRFGRLVVAAALGLVVLAFVQLRGAPVDVYPEFMPPTVQIQTEALGLSAAEVEQLVTLCRWSRTCSTAFRGWTTSARSPCRDSRRSTWSSSRAPTSTRARQMVQERLTQAHALPNVGKPADHDPAAGLDQPGRHDRAALARRVPDRHVGAGALEDPAAADGRPRRRERLDLRAARPPAAGAGRPGEADARRASRSPRSSRRPATRCGSRR